MDLASARLAFLLHLLRFVLSILAIGSISRLFMALQSHVSFSFDGRRQQSLSIRLLLGQSPLVVTLEELFFVGIQSIVIGLIGLVSGLWLSQKALQDFFHFFHLPAGFTFEFPFKGLLITQLGVLLLLFCYDSAVQRGRLKRFSVTDARMSEGMIGCFYFPLLKCEHMFYNR